MRSDRRYDTPKPEQYKCLECGAVVGAEAHSVARALETRLPSGHGQVMHDGVLWDVWFTPASRYWCDKGIFCGAACGLRYIQNGAA